MASKSINWFSVLTFIVVLCMTVIPAGEAKALTGLDTFVEDVKNGQADELRGIYIPGILAAPVVQQPNGRADFVSSWENVVTQFSLASKVGSTGLLAHNDLAGRNFLLLKTGQEFYLIYGDGQVAAYVISEVLQYQALEPNNISSEFIDLQDTGSTLSARQLFRQIYDKPGQVILQTCITINDDPSGGRLFVIAKPLLD